MLDEASPLGKEISCMMPVTVTDHQAPVPPPSYQRGQARLGPALHIDALTLVTTLHLLALCQQAVRLAHHRCPPPLPAGPGGAPRTYCEETPRIPSASQQCKRRRAAGAPVHESLFVLIVLHAMRRRLIGARDLIIDSVPILAWRRRDPDAAIGHAPAQHPRPLLLGYRVHTLLCRDSGLPIFFLLSPANVHDAPFAQPLLAWAVRLYQIRPRVIRLDAAYWGLRLITWIHTVLRATAVIPWNPKRQKNRSCLPPTWRHARN